MPSDYLEDKDICYAYQCIHHFFDVYGLPYALQYMESALKSATSNAVWKKEEPLGLLFYMETINTLCSAAFTIFYSRAINEKAIIDESENGERNMLNTLHVHDNYFNSNAWNNFPRSLTARQYHNPYKAIKKFCNYMAPDQWKAFFKEVLENAFTKTFNDIYMSYDLLTTRLKILQLIEACHLIEVRTHPKHKEEVNEEQQHFTL
jgi:hypothetical protein